jgi:cobalt-zinc-cadmium efflux system protein
MTAFFMVLNTVHRGRADNSVVDHHNSHSGHSHTGAAATLASGRLRAAIGVVALLFIAEGLAGLLAGSLALLGDAVHLFTDAGSLGLAWYATAQSRRRPTPRRSFGFHRTGILVATLNGLALAGVAALLAVAAIDRLEHPRAVAGAPVLAFGALALLANGALGAYLLGAGSELSVRSAALHVVGDALASAGVVVAGILLLTAGWRAADPAVSLGIAALIAAAAVNVLHEAVHILSEGTPRDLDAAEVRRVMLAAPGVENVHDLHIWSLDRNHRMLSAHVAVGDRPLTEVTAILRVLERTLCSHFGIEHATLQPECPSCEQDPSICDPETRHERVHQIRG